MTSFSRHLRQTSAGHLSVAVDTDAAPERVFAVLTDWPRHGEWMMLTRARVASGDGHSVGSRLAAFTGIGPVGFLDTMEITSWHPPHEVAVRHTGRLVRGTGLFRVLPRAGGGSTIVWEEDLELPLGPAVRLGWPVIRPLSATFLRRSLRRLAELTP
ncbi:SRPBCC family protein [Planotetraspora sp. A-T 1434]|uniref:SRPBCC family protein n=1 Tax=Planotetraspora sp. A-T 1434 TaxID=2979219 RepID=UPI0021C0BFFC|nr:SRPBCC family protein [Planotetraspora sp. A-T 1434]MCT9930940.1 SRPBCC family protein [Planotetraspora sp. A-T 1434]